MRLKTLRGMQQNVQRLACVPLRFDHHPLHNRSSASENRHLPRYPEPLHRLLQARAVRKRSTLRL